MAPVYGEKKAGSNRLALDQLSGESREKNTSFRTKIPGLPGLVPTAKKEPGLCLLSCPSTQPRGERGRGLHEMALKLSGARWWKVGLVSYLLQRSQTSVDQEGSGQSFGPFVTDLVLSQAGQGEEEEWLLHICKSPFLFLSTRLVIQTSQFHQHHEGLDTGGDEARPGMEVSSPGKPLGQVR